MVLLLSTVYKIYNVYTVKVLYCAMELSDPQLYTGKLYFVFK